MQIPAGRGDHLVGLSLHTLALVAQAAHLKGPVQIVAGAIVAAIALEMAGLGAVHSATVISAP